MSNTWTGAQAEKDAQLAKPPPRWTHGRLMPIETKYMKWGDKDAQGQKSPSTEVEYGDYIKLQQNQRGQQVVIQIDPKVIDPKLQFIATRKLFIGFPDWNTFVLPGLLDMIGQGPIKSVATFAERANTGNWFVEAELVLTGGMYEGKPQTTFKFTRMTLDLNELRTWHKEKFPKPTAELNDLQLDTAKVIFQKLAKGDLVKFAARINESEELMPYSDDLLEMAQKGLLN